MTNWHYNFETDTIGRCYATIKCRLQELIKRIFGIPSSAIHGKSKQEIEEKRKIFKEQHGLQTKFREWAIPYLVRNDFREDIRFEFDNSLEFKIDVAKAYIRCLVRVCNRFPKFKPYVAYIDFKVLGDVFGTTDRWKNTKRSRIAFSTDDPKDMDQLIKDRWFIANKNVNKPYYIVCHELGHIIDIAVGKENGTLKFYREVLVDNLIRVLKTKPIVPEYKKFVDAALLDEGSLKIELQTTTKMEIVLEMAFAYSLISGYAATPKPTPFRFNRRPVFDDLMTEAMATALTSFNVDRKYASDTIKFIKSLQGLV